MADEYPQENPQKIRHPVAEVNALDTRTLSGNVTLTERDGRIHRFDPGGSSRNVTLFAGSPENQGRMDWFYNTADAAENLVIKDAAGNTLATAGQAKSVGVICTGSATTSHVVFIGPV